MSSAERVSQFQLTIGMTTCRRWELFEKTAEALLNAIGDAFNDDSNKRCVPECL